MNDSTYGQLTPLDSNCDLNAAMFVARSLISQISTMKLVQVKTVYGGGVAVAGTVDVIPLVQQIDGNGYGTPHGVVPGLPWSRIQGGKSAIICDPVAGDIGYVVASDRDISKLKNTSSSVSSQGVLPGTRREFDIADGVYAGNCFGVTPTQYVIFTSTGIRIVDLNGNSVAMTSSGVVLTDASGNTITTNSSGMNLTDKNANQIQMSAGQVNIVTTAFKVNGVAVTVP